MMIQEPRGSNPREISRRTITRLERNNRELMVLRQHMRSYSCEPQTYSLFERRELLRDRLDQMRQKNNELINKFRDHKNCIEEQLRYYKDQLTEFRRLEQQVLEYIGMSKMHG